jgi:hypothetical protein
VLLTATRDFRPALHDYLAVAGVNLALRRAAPARGRLHACVLMSDRQGHDGTCEQIELDL